jgi:UDP-4-amino-4,6-dideoxy-N-acetyl-beta-L-altrosamine transaminase
MIPYGKQSITEADIQAVEKVLRSDWLTQGPRVEEFEQALCEKFGCDYAVAVNSGTMALHLAYKALGVDEGDEVVTSPNTFVATANGVVYNGGIPRFVDINLDTYNLSPEKLEEYLSNSENRKNLKGIAPVHFAGQPCGMEKIYNLARKYNLFVLEDACHAPGAEYRGTNGTWHKVGNCKHSDAAVLSFHPVKHITTGEGGAVLTNKKGLAEELKILRSHGITKEPGEMSENHGPWYYEMQQLGFNGRITDLQSALGISQLKRLDEFINRRRQIAARYDSAFKSIPEIKTPQIADKYKHAYHLYVIRCQDRDRLFEYLLDNGISPQVHYIPVHLQPYYRWHFSYQAGDYPAAEKYYKEALSLPMFPTLEEKKIEYVINTVENFYS